MDLKELEKEIRERETDNDLASLFIIRHLLSPPDPDMLGFGGKRDIFRRFKKFLENSLIELKDLIRDQNALMQVASKTGGYYMDIDSLDSMLSSIEITPVQLKKNYHLSALSSQYYCFW